MQQEFDYHEVTSKVLGYLEQNLSYQPQRLNHFRRHWGRIKNYMESEGSNSLTADLCNTYLVSIFNGREIGELTASERILIRFVKILMEFMVSGVVKRQYKIYYFEGATGNVIKDFLVYKKSCHLSADTIDNLTRNLSKFNF